MHEELHHKFVPELHTAGVLLRMKHVTGFNINLLHLQTNRCKVSNTTGTIPKLINEEKWFIYDQLIDVVNEISYLGVILESTGGSNRHKMKQMAKGNKSLVATDKCLTRTPDMKVQLLENVYEMVCESRLMNGAEIWGLDEGWKEIDIIHGRLCKKILGMPRFAAKGLLK
jgi:hypothetical protein